MKLIYRKTETEVKCGDIAHTFRGEPVVVTGWQEPRHEGSTGRVYVRDMSERGFEQGYYPSVIDAYWTN